MRDWQLNQMPGTGLGGQAPAVPASGGPAMRPQAGGAPTMHPEAVGQAYRNYMRQVVQMAHQHFHQTLRQK